MTSGSWGEQEQLSSGSLFLLRCQQYLCLLSACRVITVVFSRDIEQYYSTQIDEMPMNGNIFNSYHLLEAICNLTISDSFIFGYFILTHSFLQLLTSSRAAWASMWKSGPKLLSKFHKCVQNSMVLPSGLYIFCISGMYWDYFEREKRGIKWGFFWVWDLGFVLLPEACTASIHRPPVSQNPCLEAGSGCQESGSKQQILDFLDQIFH